MSQSDLLREAASSLEAAGVGFVLTGSLVSSIQGEPRSTHDVDLIVEVDARVVDALAAAFGADSYFFDGIAAQDALGSGGVFNIIDTRSGDKLDVWALTEDPFDVSRFERRVRVSAFGIDVPVTSPEDTILQKLRWGAAQGGSERQFRDAAGVYEVQAGMLDEAYLDRWAERLGVTGCLAEVRSAANTRD